MGARNCKSAWEVEMASDRLHTFRLAQGMVDLDRFNSLPGIEKLYPLRTSCLVSTSK